MHVYRGTNNKLIHIFQLQKSITIYLVYICYNCFYRCFFFQVDNLNLATNLKFYCFYAMLIACKCPTLYQKLDCDTKGEPPYLATTLNTLITLEFMQWPRTCHSMSKSQPTSTPNQHKLAQQFHTKFNQLKHESN
jgi:hypothetical protein